MTDAPRTQEEALALYRATGRTQRFAGFGLIVLGAVLVWIAPNAGASAGPVLQWVAYASLAGGWVLMLVAIFLRTRMRRRLMQGDR